MRIKDYLNHEGLYLVVLTNYYRKYGNNAFVDRTSYDLDEAKYIAFSISNCDRRDTLVLKVEGDKVYEV